MYKDYLESEKWKDKRLVVFEFKWKFCEKCWKIEYLNIHHWSYKKKYKEPLKHLFVLCYGCHKDFHDKYKMWKSMLNKTLNFIHWKWWRKKNPWLSLQYPS